MLAALLVGLSIGATPTPATPTAPQDPSAPTAGTWELAAGASGLLYYAAFSSDATLALEATARLAIGHAWWLAAGLRVGLGTPRVEGFGRLELAPLTGWWRPLVGAELGVGARGHYEDDDGVMGALARASRRELIPVYTALHAAPLRFALGRRWSLSLAELHVGSHIAPAGRYVRLQVGLVTLGVTP